MGSNQIQISSQTCQQLLTRHMFEQMPLSTAECSASALPSYSYFERTKAGLIKDLYSRCCKPGSKPNGMCGFKLFYPCDQPSDFLGTNVFHGRTCQLRAAATMPSSAAACDVRVAGYTKADHIKRLYPYCCKPGSKPNGICGAKPPITTTPCKNKATDEFLPGAKYKGDLSSQYVDLFLPKGAE